MCFCCIEARSAAVPSLGNCSPVIGCFVKYCVQLFLNLANLSVLYIGILNFPSATTAFKFLLPMTAPIPPRPAARSSLTTQAYLTKFSPAGPITILPNLLFPNSSCVSPVVFPFKNSASLKLI